MEDLGTLVLSLPRIPPPPRIGTSHGGLHGTGVWKLTAVSPADTV